MPTELERQGDFSKTTDNLGNPFPFIKNPAVSGTCSATSTAACFADGGVVGKIPASALYADRAERPELVAEAEHRDAVPGQAYNYENTYPRTKLLGWQPVVRVDYSPTSTLRGNFRFQEYQQPNKPIPGTIPGFNDTTQDDYGIYTWSSVINYTWGVDDLHRGLLRPQHAPPGRLLDRRRRSELVHHRRRDQSARQPHQGRLRRHPVSVPGRDDPRSEHHLVPDPQQRAGRHRVGRHARPGGADVPVGLARSPTRRRATTTRSPTSSSTPCRSNANVTLTRVAGRHTLKGGYYYFNSVQKRGQGNIFGTINFGNDTLNPLDTGFGFANAALGDLQLLLAAVALGRRRLHGDQPRGVHPGQLEGDAAADARLRHPVRAPGAEPRRLLQQLELLPRPVERRRTRRGSTCSAATPASIRARPPTAARWIRRRGQFVGTSAQASIIVGTLVPNVGNPANGLILAGQGIAKTGFTYPEHGVRAALRRRVGRQGRPEVHRPRRDRALLRSAAGQQHLRDDEQPAADRRTSRCATATCRTSRPHGPDHGRAAVDHRVRVREPAADVVPVEHRHADGDAVRERARRVVHRPAQLRTRRTR